MKLAEQSEPPLWLMTFGEVGQVIGIVVPKVLSSGSLAKRHSGLRQALVFVMLKKAQVTLTLMVFKQGASVTLAVKE